MAVGRFPTMQSSLRQLLDSGVPIASVLDVGILTGTQPLMDVLGHLPHHLFEPVDLHFDQIRSNYRNIEHELHQVAISDTDGTCYLACRSIHNNNTVTHSRIADEPVTKEEEDGFVSCTEITKSRLDTIVQQHSITKPYLLKIDVDGHEMPILRGAEQTLEDCSVVVIEAPLNRVELPQFFERSSHLMSSGFYLMDIVDLAYYNGVLWQVDLVFVRQSIVNEIDQLRPFEASTFAFDRELWNPLSASSFS